MNHEDDSGESLGVIVGWGRGAYLGKSAVDNTAVAHGTNLRGIKEDVPTGPKERLRGKSTGNISSRGSQVSEKPVFNLTPDDNKGMLIKHSRIVNSYVN